jgi:hypothetical protein
MARLSPWRDAERGLPRAGWEWVAVALGGEPVTATLHLHDEQGIGAGLLGAVQPTPGQP